MIMIMIIITKSKESTESRVTVIVKTIMIGALQTILKNAKAWYGRLSLPDIFGSAQLLTILDTAHIIQKVLCLQAAGSC